MKKGGKDGNYVQAHGAEGGDSINEYALKSSIFVEDDDLCVTGRSKCSLHGPIRNFPYGIDVRIAMTNDGFNKILPNDRR
jgi:hypothetical protein